MDAYAPLKAEALALALKQVTGEKPYVQNMGEYIRIYWMDAQLPAVQKSITEMIDKKEPGDIRLEWMSPVTPVVIKKIIPYALALVGIGYFLGKF
jgi:hypothetical protein